MKKFAIGCFAVIGVFTIIIVAIALFSTVFDFNGTTDTTTPSVIHVTAQELCSAYEANEVAADAEYKGKTLEIYGMVYDIGKDILDKPYIELLGENIYVWGVQCMFDSNYESQIAQLVKGQNVTIRGRCTGYIINVLVEDCILVNLETPPPPPTTTPPMPTTTQPPTQTTPVVTEAPIPTTPVITETIEQPPIEIMLFEAQFMELVEVNALGTGNLESIKLNITSKSDERLQLIILPGTIFESQTAGIQSMVVIEEKIVLLEPYETAELVEVNAASCNMQLDIPSESNVLTLSMTPASGELMRLLNLSEFQDFDFRIQQFAIWTITDNPGRDEYVGIGYFGLGTGPSDEEIDIIQGLFEMAGIPVGDYRALRAAVYVELIEAKNMGLIEASATGTGSINRIKISLTSKSDDTMEVAILPGTIFTSSATGVQSMVVLTEKLILLDPYETTDPFDVDAACASMELDAPEESNSLMLSTEAPPEDLMKLLNLPDFHEETFRVRQFAIWTITDNPERDGYVGIATGFSIFGTGPSDEEIEKIRVLFIKAGISISKYKALG